jgi:hypothetical protein
VKWRPNCVFGLAGLLCVLAFPSLAAPNAGRIAGVVRDASGVPQMGATVLVSAEQASLSPSLGSLSEELLTNDRGKFSTGVLPAGNYSVKVTLAGFLPSMEQHVRVSDQQTTLLDIVLGSLFGTLDKMRRDPDQIVPSDEWIWVLRAASASRPVLRWQGGQPLGSGPLEETIPTPPEDRARLELTSGSDHPGSISNFGDSPATAFVYGWNLGDAGRILMAGQFSYDGVTPGGGLATEWLPSGELGVGSETSILVRETRLGGIGGGLVFRGLRVSHDDQLALGDRVTIRYGGELVMAGYNGVATAVLPRAQLAVKFSDRWLASATVAARPWQDSTTTSDLQSAINTLDSLPTLLLHNGRSTLSDDLHEELAVERILSKSSTLTAAVFHDRTADTAVFGYGNATGPDFLPDIYSNVFAYDAGVSKSAGARLVYTKKFNDDTEASFLYAYGGVLAPVAGASTSSARDDLRTQYRSSFAARTSTRLPRTHTRVAASYKWVEGRAVSHLDPFGESLYHLDPYLSLEIRQPLPYLLSGHMEAMVDVGNLLAQGYLPLATPDGNVVLVPSCRYFRGGFSFQF